MRRGAIEIEKGVPLPPPQHRGRHKRTSRYPFEQMQVGDSLLIGGRGSSTYHNCAMYRYMALVRCPGTDWEIHRTDRGMRMWRTA